ncbi:MAG: 2-C-methyl-D-erythritol 2,4-cyclodiphosphate synthase [Deltaproteobacteria bacterium]|nr:2-C-methyl-D-erythritol 2,4-cyclodiphosphate synthase [Deltaproteobacteria bacterium]
MTGFRIGFGYDAHRFIEGRPLVLGGTIIPYDLGLAGHSDADVLIHAVIDALLGAISRGDIGVHFPDSDPAYEGVQSTELLERVVQWVREDSYTVQNIDVTIVAERPRLAPHIRSMKEKLSKILGVQEDRVSVKATTSEGMGFCGRGEGMAAYAVACLSGAEGGE